MNTKRVLLIQGHPDATEPHLCHALAASYTEAAEDAGHAVRHVDISALDFPLLRSEKDYQYGPVPTSLKSAQDDILWAGHIVLFFPLWAGDMPALVKGFFEQMFRPNVTGANTSHFSKKPLAGRTARVVVTMGMPALVYRSYFRANSLQSLERNLLGMVGIAPVHATLIGMTGHMKAAEAGRWLVKIKGLGQRAE